jgi:hypothetical protein
MYIYFGHFPLSVYVSLHERYTTFQRLAWCVYVYVCSRERAVKWKGCVVFQASYNWQCAKNIIQWNIRTFRMQSVLFFVH